MCKEFHRCTEITEVSLGIRYELVVGGEPNSSLSPADVVVPHRGPDLSPFAQARTITKPEARSFPVWEKSGPPLQHDLDTFCLEVTEPTLCDDFLRELHVTLVALDWRFRGRYGSEIGAFYDVGRVRL